MVRLYKSIRKAWCRRCDKLFVKKGKFNKFCDDCKKDFAHKKETAK